MRVLFLMFTFPDLTKSFNMYTALVEEFRRNGHDVFVLAPDNERKKTGIRNENGIPILRVETLPLKNVPNYIKGLSNLFLPYQYSRALKRYASNRAYDAIVVPTPPITLVNLAHRLKRKHSAKLYLILRDIFPQNAVDLGFLKRHGLLHSYFRRKEKKLYKVADSIGCMSAANVRYVLTHNSFVDPRKLHVLQNYQIKNDRPLKQANQIKESYGLANKFVIVFGGNMGRPQQLENVIDLAKKCETYSDVVFLLLGDGVQRKNIEELVFKTGISNVVLRSTIPKVDYQNLISACDVGLISLHKDFTVPNIPSKALDYFNLGIPILASIDRATDFGEILETAGAGLWSYSGDTQSFKANFDMLYRDDDLRRTLGENGRRYFETFLTPDKAYDVVLKNLLSS